MTFESITCCFHNIEFQEIYTILFIHHVFHLVITERVCSYGRAFFVSAFVCLRACLFMRLCECALVPTFVLAFNYVRDFVRTHVIGR